MTRTLVVWCPDWPVRAAGSAQVPGAVVRANRVVACSAPARAQGVRRGMRRREAQSRCPDLAVLPHDPARDARAFEPVVQTVEGFCPRVEIVRPGVCALEARGPARYFGGEAALAEQMTAAVGHGSRVGIARGVFAAVLAARDGVIVERGGTPAFLAPVPVTALDRPELADLLVRLGIRTLGAFAALPRSRVVERFGDDAALAHRLAAGDDDHPLATREPAPELAVHRELDPPAVRVDQAAFAAKALADELHERMDAEGVVCTRIRIEVETEHGEELVRLWRHDGGLTAHALADRVRWQLDGWLTASSPGGTPGPPRKPGDTPGPPSGGIAVLRLVPDEVKPATGRQRGFWGSETQGDLRAARALARVQGMLGPEAVCTPVLSGGREPADQVTLVAWGESREPARPGSPGEASVRISGWHQPELPPWPGRLGGPAPATVRARPVRVEVVDAEDAPVGVEGRGLLAAPPARVDGRTVQAWAGPWLLDECWWDTDAHRRRARFQVLLDDGSAHLLALDGGRWWLEATYD